MTCKKSITYRKEMEMYKILNNDGTGPFRKDAISAYIKYTDGKPEYAYVGNNTIKNESKLKKITNFFLEPKKGSKIKYSPVTKQYSIMNNDGTGPLEKEIVGVLISYDEGKPVRAILGIEPASLKQVMEEPYASLRTEEEKSKVEKIAKFFN